MITNDDSIGIDVVDVAADYRELAIGLGVGLSLMMTLIIAGRTHGVLLISVLGALFLLFALSMLLRILIVIRWSRAVPARVTRVWVERYRKPGYAGVHPRFRVMADVVSTSGMAIEGAVCFPFPADNEFEDLSVAKATARELCKCSTVHIGPTFSTFVIAFVGSERWVTPLAWCVTGIVFSWVGRLLSV